MSRGFGGRIVEEVVEAVAFSQRGDCRSGGNTIFWGTLNLDESMPNRLCLWSLFFPIGDARFFIDRVLMMKLGGSLIVLVIGIIIHSRVQILRSKMVDSNPNFDFSG